MIEVNCKQDNKKKTEISYSNNPLCKLTLLIEYCQGGNKVCPLPQCWNKIYHSYSWRADTHDFGEFPPLRAPFLFDAWNTSSNEKRLRFLTQIYWCYQNNFIDSLYESIMSVDVDSWQFECCDISPLPLDVIKKEYGRWLGLKYFLLQEKRSNSPVER